MTDIVNDAEGKELQPKGLPCGIYFGLPDERYRRDPALNYSGMKALLHDGATSYWFDSPLNPDWKPKKQTDSMRLGQVLHCMLLEPTKFTKRYYITPDEYFVEGKTPVRRTDYEVFLKMVNEVRSFENFSGLLQKGEAEVVIIWEDPTTGIRLKAKHDYWKPFSSIDYKSSYGVSDKNIESTKWKYRYDIQAYHYIESRRVIREMLLNKKADVYGTSVNMKIIDRFLKGEENEDGYFAPMDLFLFIFQSKEPPHEFRALQMNEQLMYQAQVDTRKAIEKYVRNLQRFGHRMWPPNSGRIESWTPYGFEEAGE